MNRVPQFCLHRPTSVEGALEILAGHESAAVLMGGTELLPLLKLGLSSVEHLIDCRGLMSDLRRDGDQLIVGASVIHRRLETDPIVRDLIPAISGMEQQLANIRVRNVGTLGGNLCFAEPRSDPATLLVALEAAVTLRSRSGARIVPVEDFLVGPFATALEPGEVMVDVRIPIAGPGERVGFRRLAFGERPAANIAFKVGSPGIRIAVGAVGLKVGRAFEAERLLREGGGAALGAAAEAAMEEIETVTDVDGSADYKRHLVGVLVRRALRPALADAG